VSNLQALTAFTPLVWDQYRQSIKATQELVRQIQNLHNLSDRLFSRTTTTQVRITAVGHSLGGGLASYVFLRVSDITRVVAFNPSPVNGSSKFSPLQMSAEKHRRGIRDRDSVQSNRRQPIDHDPRAPDAAMFTLYEEGDILTRLFGCHNGPIWGAEGGPVVRCDSVNFSYGNNVHQHNMPQLACKLFLAKSGKATR